MSPKNNIEHDKLMFKRGLPRFYEVFYLICSDPVGQAGFWFRYTLLNPGDDKPQAGAGLWAGVSTLEHRLGIHKTVPAPSPEPVRDGLGLVVADLGGIEPGKATGKLETDGHTIEWDLYWTGPTAGDTGLHPYLSYLLEPAMGMRIPYPRAEFSGTVVVDGEPYNLNRVLGHQAHHWGRRKVPGWAWGHACMFDDASDTVVEVLHPSFTRGPGIKGPVFVNLKTPDGTWWRYAGYEAEGSACTYEPGKWVFRVTGLLKKVEVEFSSGIDQVVDFLYHSPLYEKSICSNAPLARVHVKAWARQGPLLKWIKVLDTKGWGTAEITRPI